MSTNGTTTGMLTYGWFRDTSSITVSNGTILYLSGTSGAFTINIPTSGYVRIIGYLAFTNTVFFNPDNTFIDL